VVREETLLEVGRVVRPHGLNGQVVVELWTNRRERVAPGAHLEGPAGELHVVRSSSLGPAGGRARWLVAFQGVDSREAAERLRGAVLEAAPIDEPGALWVHQLIGTRVMDDRGTDIGTVEAVEANPASDLLVLDNGRLIPLAFVTAQAAGCLTVTLPPGLLDL
jgi:16S rRNA processing protein RimM